MLILRVLDIHRRQRAILHRIILPVKGGLTLRCGLVVRSIEMARFLHGRILVESVNRGHGEMHSAARRRTEQRFEAVQGGRVDCQEGGKWVLPKNRASVLLLHRIIVKVPWIVLDSVTCRD